MLVSKHTRVQVVDGEPTNPSGKAFIEPEFAPPVHSDQVAEPLVCQLVHHDAAGVGAVMITF